MGNSEKIKELHMKAKFFSKRKVFLIIYWIKNIVIGCINNKPVFQALSVSNEVQRYKRACIK